MGKTILRDQSLYVFWTKMAACLLAPGLSNKKIKSSLQSPKWNNGPDYSIGSTPQRSPTFFWELLASEFFILYLVATAGECLCEGWCRQEVKWSGREGEGTREQQPSYLLRLSLVSVAPRLQHKIGTSVCWLARESRQKAQKERLY